MTSFKFCLPYFLGYYLYYSHFLEVYRGSRRFPFLSPGSLLFTYSHRSASFKGVDILFADRVPGSVISTAIDLGCCGPFRFPFPVLRQVQEGMVVLGQTHSLQVYIWFFKPAPFCCPPFWPGICPVFQKGTWGFLRDLIYFLLFR